MNAPRINPDDPKWTAYVLGELDPAERAEVERLLDTSADARALVAELQLATTALEEELASQAPLVMTREQRAAVSAAAEAHSSRRLAAFATPWAWGLGAAAAVLVALAVTVPGPLRGGRSAATSAPIVDAVIGSAPAQPVVTSSASAPAAADIQADVPGAMPFGTSAARVAVGTIPPEATSVVVRLPRSNTEEYNRIGENPFIRVRQDPLATFSIDVDTASYSNVRRFLNQDRLPPKDAVRIEELLNYFDYSYRQPAGSMPIAADMEVAAAPWNPQHRLVRIGIKAREIDRSQRPASNLVFLVDVSGSMGSPEKLPLVKSALQMLVNQLDENDRISIVTYASATEVVLPATSGDRRWVILDAINALEWGGGTNGGRGIQLAYAQATDHFIGGGVNRVILMTDGDFNVGITSQGDLTRLIEERARSGVFLSVLGFGMGNLRDSTMEQLADRGNGHYAYIDTLEEARKVLVEQMGGTLVTVAKDVKVQVDFNPDKVEAYRLIGYENRVLRPEEFNDDQKDAGEMGAGHTVTAFFEIIPRGGSVPGPSVDPSVFQPEPAAPLSRRSTSEALLVLRLRYKLPQAIDSRRMDVPLTDGGGAFSAASQDFRFAASVAAFGMILRDSPHAGSATLGWVADEAAANRGQDRNRYREEFVALVRQASVLKDAGVTSTRWRRANAIRPRD